MKLVVCFPGIGYHCDKPLLYYSRRLARADREVLVQYAYQKPGLRGNPAALRTALSPAFTAAARRAESPYNGGDTSGKIVQILRTFDFSRPKVFYDCVQNAKTEEDF